MPDKCPENCPLVPRVEALEEANKNYDRINEGVISRLGKLETENAVQNAHYKAIDEKLDEHTVMLKELTGKAGKRWDALVEKILLAIASAAIAFLLAKIGF